MVASRGHDVVHRDDLDVAAGSLGVELEEGAEEVSPDPPETVDADPHAHFVIPSTPLTSES